MTTITNISAFKEQRRIQRETQGRPAHAPSMPAYSDPANKVIGSHYQATKNLDVADIAKRMRADVKAAIKAGTLPKGIKVSVKIERASMMQAIAMRITDFPTPVYREAYAVAVDFGADYWSEAAEKQREIGRYTPAVSSALEGLTRIHNAYNFKNIDSMSNYSNVNYSGGVDVSLALEDEAMQYFKEAHAAAATLMR